MVKDNDGRSVDPANESAGVPDILQERLRAVGATDDELSRLRDEYEEQNYQERMLANQQARGYDDASVYAYLTNARDRWNADEGGRSGEDLAREQNVAVDSGQVRTVPAPEATSEPRTVEPPSQDQAALRGQPGAGPTPSEVVGDAPTEAELRGMVPTGPAATRDVVLSWVEEGGDQQRAARARAALYVEQNTSGEEPRSSLVTKLEKLV